MSPLFAALLLSSVAIENVRVEVGDGSVLEQATVVFDQGLIVSVGTLAPPPDATRVDGAGKVLTPGLLSAGSNLGKVEVDLEPSARDTGYAGTAFTPALRAADGFNPASVWIPVSREEGVTATVVLPGDGIIQGTGHWAELSGSLAELPDATQPVAMFASFGLGPAAAAGGSRAGLWLRLRELWADTRFFARHRAAVDANQTRALFLAPPQLEAMAPVVDGRLLLVLEVNRAADILAALRFAREEKVRLAISGGAEAWKVAAQLAAAKVPVIYTPSAAMPSTFETVHARDDAPLLLERAGVSLVLNTSEGQPRRLRQEAGIAVAYGLPRARALRAITLAPAELFGRKDVGAVAVGKRANLVLWSGDPLELSSVAERVYLGGVEQSLDTRQRRLVEKYRRR